MRCQLFAAMVPLLAITGCVELSGIPNAEPFPDTSLRRVKSVQHWDVIASDVAAQTGTMKGRADLRGKALYVVPDERSDFLRGFRTLLTTRLVNGGFPVSTKAEGAIEVRYEAQVVRHTDAQQPYPPGTVTALAGGALVQRQIAVGNSSANAKVAESLALVGLSEPFIAKEQLYRPTNTEVIVTTSLIDGGRFLTRKTDIYYVEDSEGTMFEPPRWMATKTMKVVGE